MTTPGRVMSSLFLLLKPFTELQDVVRDYCVFWQLANELLLALWQSLATALAPRPIKKTRVKSSSCPLLELPPELLVEILRFAMAPLDGGIVHTMYNNTIEERIFKVNPKRRLVHRTDEDDAKHGPSILSLLLTCRAVHELCVPIFYGEHVLRFSSCSSYSHFYGCIGHAYLDTKYRRRAMSQIVSNTDYAILGSYVTMSPRDTMIVKPGDHVFHDWLSRPDDSKGPWFVASGRSRKVFRFEGPRFEGVKKVDRSTNAGDWFVKWEKTREEAEKAGDPAEVWIAPQRRPVPFRGGALIALGVDSVILGFCWKRHPVLSLYGRILIASGICSVVLGFCWKRYPVASFHGGTLVACFIQSLILGCLWFTFFSSNY